MCVCVFFLNDEHDTKNSEEKYNCNCCIPDSHRINCDETINDITFLWYYMYLVLLSDYMFDEYCYPGCVKFLIKRRMYGLLGYSLILRHT